MGPLRRADRLRAHDPKKPTAAVVAALTGQTAEMGVRSYQTITATGEPVGRWSTDGAGRLVVEIDVKHLMDGRRDAVLAAIAAALDA